MYIPIDTSLYKWRHLSIISHLSVSLTPFVHQWTLTLFHIFTIASVNMGMQMSLWGGNFISFVYIPQRKIFRLYGVFIFNFSKKLATVFHKDYNNLIPHQLCTEVPFPPYLFQVEIVIIHEKTIHMPRPPNQWKPAQELNSVWLPSHCWSVNRWEKTGLKKY